MYNNDFTQRPALPSTGRLLRSTVAALLVAMTLLVTAVMPAEYGIDPTGIGRVLGLQAMGEIKKSATAPAAQGVAPVAAAAPATSAAPAASAASVAARAGSRSDQVSLTLKPGEGAEMKLEMEKGASVQYRWATRDGAVNFDAHGEASENSFAVSYKKGKDARQDEGTLEAAFKGQHGWYWKNRGKQPVTVDLSTDGAYSAIKRVL